MTAGENQQISDRICVFVSSSDRTRDVFLQVYRHFDAMWPACPFMRYVGLTSTTPGEPIYGFTAVPSGGESSWARELADQIRALPASVGFVLLLLDDFLLLEPVDGPKIAKTLAEAVAKDLPYLRLKPLDRSWLIGACRRAAAAFKGNRFDRLSVSEPYYSALQAALWKRDHLLRCLEAAESIWQFEHMVPAGATHHAVTRRILRYRHMVQRSVWRAYAPALFRRLGLDFDPGKRPMRPSGDVAFYIWEKAKFAAIGFAGMRLKRALAKYLSSSP